MSLDPKAHRALGVELFNHVWTFLEKERRTPEDEREMVDAAHASAWHWSRAEGFQPINGVRSDWQISRVYSVLGRGEPAMFHARRCLACCEALGVGDWDLVFAHEAVARAAGTLGDRALLREHFGKAVECAAQVAEEDDREHCYGELAELARAKGLEPPTLSSED